MSDWDFLQEFNPWEDTKVICSAFVYEPARRRAELSPESEVRQAVLDRGVAINHFHVYTTKVLQRVCRDPKGLLPPLHSVCRDCGPTIYHVHRKSTRGYRPFSHLSRIYNSLSA